MTWYPTRVLPSIATVGVFLACVHSGVVGTRTVTPTPPPPPPGSMRADETAREHATSIEQLLAGRLSGVTVTPAPGGGIIVRMGGPTSFYGSQEPLFIVDGVPLDAAGGRLRWLNPQDVESIQALKDPSQTAMYGVRGANGVILIRTKGSH